MGIVDKKHLKARNTGVRQVTGSLVARKHAVESGSGNCGLPYQPRFMPGRQLGLGEQCQVSKGLYLKVLSRVMEPRLQVLTSWAATSSFS